MTKDLSQVELSDLYLAVCLDDPETIGELGSKEAAERALVDELSEEDEEFQDRWAVARFSQAAVEEFQSNGGDIQNMGLENGIVYAEHELSAEEQAEGM